MIKIIISLLVFLSLEVSAESIYNTNMDKKIYYDADRSHNDKLAQMSEELDKFIHSEVNQSVIEEYKNAKVQLSQEEQELQLQNGNSNTVVSDKNITTKKKSFWDSMLDKVGLGSKKGESKVSQSTQNKPSFLDRMFEKIGIGSTKTLSSDDNTTATDK